MLRFSAHISSENLLQTVQKVGAALTEGPFTWKEDDPSTRIILESEQKVGFGLHEDFNK